MTYWEAVFPFTAIVGQEKMKMALLLNAINPNLGGVLIRGEKGTAKSTAVRALAALLPSIEMVSDCPFNCSPHDKKEMCDGCKKRIETGEAPPIVIRKVKMVDLPLGATEDRVVGTLDIEHAIKKGEKIFEPGILAEANRGILYVDEVNLLDDHLVDVLLDAAAMGVNIVEREGVSYSHPARFILVGTMNPEEGELRPQLLDRFGLCVNIQGISEIQDRIEVVKRRVRYESEPLTFNEEWQKEEEKLRNRIVKAMELLFCVTYSEEILSLVAQIAVDMGVDGHRADIAMIKTARTIAAYHERTEVTEEDVRLAAELVLPHRMRRKPFQKPEAEQEKLEKTIRKAKGQDGKRARGEKREKENNDRNEENKSEKSDASSEITFDVGESFPVKRLISPLDDIKRNGSGRRSKTKTESKSGRYVRSAIPNGKINDIAFDATFRAAAPHQLGREKNGNAIVVEKSDIRQKVREKKIGNTILFLVDASGSMGANQRMIETKGAILSLLIDAYQKRDKVGLVAFKGENAEVLLHPTSSVELAKKQLEELPTGGRTPMSKGLSVGYEVLQREINRNCRGLTSARTVKPLLILISDGKTNVSMGELNPIEDAKRVAFDIKKAGIKSVVLDTEAGFVTLGKTKEICNSLGGKYYKMEDLKAQKIVDIVSLQNKLNGKRR
jgi:magnesium chelatase subunit D